MFHITRVHVLDASIDHHDLCFILHLYTCWPQALVSFKKYMPPPLPYFKVNICPLPFPHFASICFAYLWSFRWPNCIVTLPRYFSFRLPHLNINTGPPSDELDKNSQRKSHFLFFSQWNGYSHKPCWSIPISNTLTSVI